MPWRPSAPILGQRSRGKRLLLSISAARGAISLAENCCTVSRMASAVSPRSKLNIRCALGIMVGRPPGKSCGWCRAQPYALQISLSRAELAEKGASGHGPGPRGCDAAECGKLTLALARATGCNSRLRRPFGTNHGRRQSGDVRCTEHSKLVGIPIKALPGTGPG